MKKFRVCNVINMPNKPLLFPVESLEHARDLIDALAKSELLDDAIITNAFWLEEYEDGEWIEWTDEDGYDLDAYFEKLDSITKEN